MNVYSLKYDGDNVVANVPFALELLGVGFGEGEQGGHVQHDLLALVLRVERVLA